MGGRALNGEPKAEDAHCGHLTRLHSDVKVEARRTPPISLFACSPSFVPELKRRPRHPTEIDTVQHTVNKPLTLYLRSRSEGLETGLSQVGMFGHKRSKIGPLVDISAARGQTEPETLPKLYRI